MLQTIKQSVKKKTNKKGFTLIEVIVVLVILAILAAILIPSMIGWINKAQDKSSVVEARSVLLAEQTIASENYKMTDSQLAGALKKDGSAVTGFPEATYAKVMELAEVSTTGTAAVTSVTFSNHKVTAMTYVSTDGVTVTLANGNWTTSK